MKRLILIVLLISLSISAQQESQIYQDNTHFRKGPGSYYPLIGVLLKQAVVTVLSETSGWVKIKFQGQEGYISQNALSQGDRESSSMKNTGFYSSQPTFISKASASGAVKGFAQTYLNSRKANLSFLDQYDAVYFEPGEYERFKNETYRNRNPEKIQKRIKRIKGENRKPEVTSYLEKLGFGVAGQIATNGLDTDPQKLKYLNMVGNLVVESTPLYYYPFKFYILDDSRPTAYAAPNGMIFVSNGLLNIMQSEAELACILGHEISHVVQQHGYAEVMKRTTQIAAEDAFADLEEESSPEFSDAELDELASQMFEASVSRRQNVYEVEADRMGASYAYRAGYDPRGLPAMLMRIKSMTSPDFFHPESNWQYDAIGDRVDEINRYISAELSDKPEWNVSNSQRFSRYFK